jgi:hypothetical protein
MARPIKSSISSWPTRLVLGGAGTVGAALTGHDALALSTLLVTALTVTGGLLLGKRRDDLFGKIATSGKVDSGVLREINIRDAILSGRLSSEDTVRLLRADLDGGEP